MAARRAGNLVPTRFDFDVHVHEVRPWIAMPVPLVLMWQRGDRRTGVSQTLYAVPDEENPESNQFRILVDEHFRVAATLYFDASSRGPRVYQKKCVIFALHEATSDASNLPKGQPLARAILDLAEFGDVDGHSFRTILVSTNRQIANMLGAPSMNVTVCFTGRKMAPTHKVLAPPPREGELGDLYSAFSESRPQSGNEEEFMGTPPGMSAYDDEDAMTEASYAYTDLADERAEESYWESNLVMPLSYRSGSPGHDTSLIRSGLELSAEYRQDARGVGRAAATAAASAALKSSAGKREPPQYRRYYSDLSRAPSLPSTPYSDDATLATYGRPASFTSSSDGRSDLDRRASPQTYEHPIGGRGFGARGQTPPRSPGGRDYGSFLYPVTPYDRASKLDRLSRIEAQRKADEERRKQEEDRLRMLQAGERARLEREILDEVQEKVVEERSKLEEIANEVADALAGAAAAEERARNAERSFQRLPGEIRDAALAELAVYSVEANHGLSRHKLHTPARRIARAYLFSQRFEDVERVGSAARTALSAVILAARAAGEDTARLAFWWSNAVMLREAIQHGEGSDLLFMPGDDHDAAAVSRESDSVSGTLESVAEREAEAGNTQHGASERRPQANGASVAQQSGESNGVEKKDSGLENGKERFPGDSGPGEQQESQGQNGTAGPIQGARSLGETSASVDDDKASFMEDSEPNLYPDADDGQGMEADLEFKRSNTEPSQKLKREIFRRQRSVSQGGGLRSMGSLNPSEAGSIGFGSFDSVEAKDGPSSQLGSHQKSSSQQVRETWGQGSAIVASLRRLEEWLHSKILHLLWTQVFIPLLQRVPPSNGSQEAGGKNGKVVKAKKSTPKKGSSGISAAAQSNNAADRWAAALEESIRRLCPARACGEPCGCLLALPKQILAQCVARLDVALFNAMLRGSGDMASTDPLADPVTDPRALLFPVGHLNFGHGLQLKIAVSAWTDVVHEFFASSDDPLSSPAQSPVRDGRLKSSPVWDAVNRSRLPAAPDEAEGGGRKVDLFPHVKAMGDLLMLPKAMLADHNVRKEVCGPLSLQVIRRIIYLFKPDGSDADYVSPSLLAAINAEVKIQSRSKTGSAKGDQLKVAAPPAVYSPPPPALVQNMLGSVGPHSDQDAPLVLEKGNDSDEEFGVLESPLEILSQTFGAGATASLAPSSGDPPKRAVVLTKYKPLGYRLLKGVWKN